MIKLFDVVPGWVYASAVAALLVVTGVSRYQLSTERLAHQTTKTEHALQLAEAAGRMQALSEQYRDAEKNLQTTINTTRKDADAKINTARATADSLRERLRQYTAPGGLVPPPGGIAGTGQAAGINNGAIVLGTLGEEDVSEAERAEVIRLDLLACYASYDAARSAP